MLSRATLARCCSALTHAPIERLHPRGPDHDFERRLRDAGLPATEHVTLLAHQSPGTVQQSKHDVEPLQGASQALGNLPGQSTPTSRETSL